jgi:hypothetical protein
MSRLSFISSFRVFKTRTVAFLLAIAVSVFILDRLCFSLFFPLYDQWLRVGSALRGSDILLVGSSHIEADIDLKLLNSLKNETVGLFSVPGAGLTPRYYAIKERLELIDVPRPRTVVLETTKLVFNSVRYFDDVSDYLIAYRNKGYFREYVDKYGPRHSNWAWYQLFQSYSLNGGIDKFSEPGNVVRFFAENLMSNEEYIHFRSKLRGPDKSCLTQDHVDYDARIEDWDRVRKTYQFDNQVDPHLVETLGKIVNITQKYGVKLILLDPPFYRFQGDPMDDGFNQTRLILKNFERPGVTYVGLPIPNQSCLFNDEGHLSSEGQKIFTSEFVKEI